MLAGNATVVFRLINLLPSRLSVFTYTTMREIVRFRPPRASPALFFD